MGAIAASLADAGEELAKVVAAWASPIGVTKDAATLTDLNDRVNEFAGEHIAAAVVHVLARLQRARIGAPPALLDLAFRLNGPIAAIYAVDSRVRRDHLCRQAAARLEAVQAGLVSAAHSFLKTGLAGAKSASIEVVRNAHALLPLALPGERPLLREIDVMLGSAFRKFCEAYERHDSLDVLRRAGDITTQLRQYAPITDGPRSRSDLWRTAIKPIADHLSHLIDEATTRSEAASSPRLQIANAELKADLAVTGRQLAVICRLSNSGDGRALRITPTPNINGLPVEVELLDPKDQFEVAGHADQLVTLGISLTKSVPSLRIPITWDCHTSTGRAVAFEDVLLIAQQNTQPDWMRITANPPYTTNPIKQREALFGRDAVLHELAMHVAGGISTFVWGQKRVGKTSVLQVLVGELQRDPETVCVLLRMGELVSLHEGQVAHRIAERIAGRVSLPFGVPREEEFGAGLGRLVPFVERAVAEHPTKKFVVVIDEFDDLESAFYTGERGRQFVKALRSISEIGATFFFVGSERMGGIYRRHQADLNKWVNVRLDRIGAKDDCRALVTRPVQNIIEYQPDAVERIVEYCLGNPFYMHLLCFEIFKRCAQERRTYVSASDVEVVREHLVRALGRTNFAHFWDDNPELDDTERERQAAENCLALSCVSALGGRADSFEDVVEAQERIGLSAAERLPATALRVVLERLRQRRVLDSTAIGGGFVIPLPILRDWLVEWWEPEVVTQWKDFQARAARLGTPEERVAAPPLDPSAFPIPEDDLLAVSQRLVFCGKQKDVAEVRLWLRQFDEDSRIETAFLLLKRLAERGYVSEGDRVHAMATLQEMVSKRRREVGNGVSRVVRGRLDNLCLAYVDSETKSGASLAREITKAIRPGKCASQSEVATWAKQHLDDDPMIVVVDDFAGTGRTLAKGLERLQESMGGAAYKRYVAEGRISCYVLFAFPEAIEFAQEQCSGIEVRATRFLGDDLRALDPEAGLFESAEELQYAHEVLLQIGRELTPQNPLGFGDMGGLVMFHNTIPNNTLPIFWSNGTVNERQWKPLFPRG